MPSIAQNNAAAKALKESGKLTPVTENSAPTPPAAPLIPDFPAQPAKYLNSPLPANMWQSPDQQRQFQNGAIPQTRISPLPPNTNPAVGAAAASQAITIVSSPVTAAKIGLDIPTIFTPVNQIVTLPGPLEFELAPEPVGTVFQVPPAGSGGGRFDTQQTFFGTSSTPISGIISPSLPDEFGLWFVASNGSGPGLPSPGAGWTQVSTNPPLSLFTTIFTQPGISAPLSYSASAPGSSYSGIVGLFFTNGSAPVLAQPLLSNGTTSVAINNTVGNTNIVTISFSSTATPPTNFSISDSNGNSYAGFPLTTDGLVGGTIALMFIATNVIGGPNTITFIQVGASANIEMAVMEWKNIIQVDGIPRFAPLTADMVPPIDLSQDGVNGGVINILGAGNGGTGIASPGAAGNVLTSNGTAWVSAAGSGSSGFGGTNIQTTNYTILTADLGKDVIANSGSAIQFTLPNPPPSSTWAVFVQNIGAGTLTVNRNSLTIDNAASNLTLTTSQGVVIFTDGTNYFTERGMATGSSGITSINSETGPAITIAAGSNITVTTTTNTVTIAASGGGTPGGSLGDIQIGDGTFFTNLAGRSGGGIFNASNTGNLTIEPIQDLQLNPGQLGFFGATPIAKPTVTGSRAGNAALASLLTTLANQGLLTDSSTP